MDYLSTGARSLDDHFSCAMGGHEPHNTDKKCFFGHPLQPCTGTTVVSVGAIPCRGDPAGCADFEAFVRMLNFAYLLMCGKTTATRATT